jgi:hypothetical protein
LKEIKKMLNHLVLFLFTGAALSVAAETGTNTNEPEKPSDPAVLKQWQDLRDRNLLLQEQLTSVTGEQNLIKSYIPALPSGVTPGFERRGDASIVGAIATYGMLKDMAGAFVRDIGEIPTLPACNLEPGKRNGRNGSVAACEDPNNPSQAVKKYDVIWLQGQREALAIAQLPAFRAQLKTAICRISAVNGESFPECKPKPVQIPGEMPPPPPPKDVTGDRHALMAPLAISAIAPLVQTALGIFELFRSRVTVTTTAVPADELAFSAMIAHELTTRNVTPKVLYASMFPVPILPENEARHTILSQVEQLRDQVEKLGRTARAVQDGQGELDTAVQQADQKVADHTARIKQLEERMDRLEDRITWSDREHRREWEVARADAEVRRNELQRALPTLRDAARTARKEAESNSKKAKDLLALLDKALALQNGLFEKVDTDTLLTKILRLEAVDVEWTKDCSSCASLQLTVHAAAAESKQTQNYWVNRETVGGGAIASYFLYDRSGKIIKSFAHSRFGRAE